MSWKNNSQRHSLSAKGVKTSYDSSGIWFESRGILRDTPLTNEIDVEGYIAYLKEEYNIPWNEILHDIEHVYILPSKKVDESVTYLDNVSKDVVKRYRRMIIDIAKMAKSKISSKLSQTKNLQIKDELHKSYNKYDELIKKWEKTLWAKRVITEEEKNTRLMPKV